MDSRQIQERDSNEGLMGLGKFLTKERRSAKSNRTEHDQVRHGPVVSLRAEAMEEGKRGVNQRRQDDGATSPKRQER